MAFSIFKILKSMSPGVRPSGQTYGIPYVNFGDNQYGVFDSSNTPRDLIGVPFFSMAATYAQFNPVVYQGQLYFANGAIPAGAWNASQWTPASGAATGSVRYDIAQALTAAQKTQALVNIRNNFPTYTIILASGTFTVKANCVAIKVRLVGGGGGGCGGSTAGNAGNGGSGTATSFGAGPIIASAAAGTGGTNVGNAGVGGATSSCTVPANGIALPGSFGTIGMIPGPGANGIGGIGAPSILGGGGILQNGGYGWGGGGNGGVCTNNALSGFGGPGGGSGAYVEFRMAVVAGSSYPCTIGAGGAGGAAGTYGGGGVAGAGGGIIVEEYYGGLA